MELRFSLVFVLLVVLLLEPVPGQSQDSSRTVSVEASAPPVAAGHSFHGEAFNEGPRQAASLMPGLGRAKFPITTQDETAQAFFNQGVDQLHGFWYFEAERSFRQVAYLDPHCAMAFWGMAMANINNEQRAKSLIATAVEKKGCASEREQLYIDALSRYYGEGDKKSRAEKLIVDLEEVVCKFPDDVEGKAFLAFQLWKNRDAGIPLESRVAVDALLEQVFAASPMHPAHHYEIHLWDDHRGEMALRSAALCGPALPGIAHMWHMPGHTYAELKRYDDATWQMEASARVDHAYMERNWVMPDQIHNFSHNNEWLIRNYIYVGRAQDAIALARNMIAMPRHPGYNTLEKQASAKRGRERMIDGLRQFEMWPQLVEFAQSPYAIEPDPKSATEIERRRLLGEAYFQLPDLQRGQAVLDELIKELENAKSERDAALAAQRQTADEEALRAADELDLQVAAMRWLVLQTTEMIGAPRVTPDAFVKLERLMRREANRQTRQSAVAAETSLQQSFQARIDSLEKAVGDLNGYAAAARGNYPEAIKLLDPSGAQTTPGIARLRLAAGETDAALEAAREYFESHKNEAIPLASLADLLWRAGRSDEAIAALNHLRSLTGSMDLDAPVFARLSPIAAAAGLPNDWRQPSAPGEDIGDRPDPASLGPIAWSPPRARDWVLPDADGQPVSLKDYSGRPIVLVFFLGHGCLHCVEQIQALAQKASAFAGEGIELVAISTDPIQDLRRALDNSGDEKLPIRLLSDASFDVFKSYRAFDDFEHQPLHATLLVDPLGRIRWLDISHQPFMDVEFLLGECKRLLALGE